MTYFRPGENSPSWRADSFDVLNSKSGKSGRIMARHAYLSVNCSRARRRGGEIALRQAFHHQFEGALGGYVQLVFFGEEDIGFAQFLFRQKTDS
ncbi:MAG: hypothetical protein BECKG1743E_GA0114224_108314, partial [Candidatus Kentron sp. G]